MNDLTPTPQERTAKLKGLGTSRKRVEDVRFTQGKGNYVDDIKMPGMLHGDFVRSPYAHARVKSINADAARALPGVIAVLTAADLAPLNLHWMPTLAPRWKASASRCPSKGLPRLAWSICWPTWVTNTILTTVSRRKWAM